MDYKCIMTGKAKPQDAKQKRPEGPENWAEDQKERSYYYDDACGYETYEAENDEAEEDDDDDDINGSS